MSQELFFLIKIGQYKHLKSFVEEGEIYMQPLRTYIDIEHDQIGDKHEGLSVSWQPCEVKVEVDGVEIKDIIGPIRITDSTAYNPPVYCLYAFAPSCISDSGNHIDPRCCGFGQYAVIIKKYNEFNRRLSSVFKNNCKGILRGQLVEYVDYESYHGEMGVFRKYSCFKYQSEYRYAWDRSGQDGGSFKIKLGNLEDICILCPVEYLNSLIKVSA